MSAKTRSILVLLALTSALLLTVSLMQAQSTITDMVLTYIGATSEPDGQIKVSAFVSVLDEEGRPVRPTEVDFVIFENRNPVESLLAVGRISAPLKVALLIDTSGNMARPGRDGVRAIDTAKDSAVSFIDALSEADQVAVYEYDNELRRRQGFTYDHNLAIDQSVVRLEAGQAESTCLYDALAQLLEEWEEAESSPQAVVVITGNPTGRDSDSCRGTALDEVLDQAELTSGNPIPIYTVGFGRQVEVEALQQLARFTGGYTLVGADSAEITELVRKISNQLKGQFEISYLSQAETGLARVEVVENNSQKSDTRQVFIPERVEPTPTPLPSFEIGLTGSQLPGEDTIQLTLEIPAEVVLAKTELFVDDNLVQQVDAPPFGTFEVDTTELGPGTHRLRVEATDESGRIASSEIEATVNVPPTPTSTPPPTPEQPAAPPAAEAEPDSDLGSGGLTSTLSIFLIGAGVLLLLALVGLIIYVLFFYGRQSAIATEPPPPPPPVSPMITIDDMDATEIDMQPAPVAAPAVAAGGSIAKLILLQGQHAVSDPEYRLDQPEVKIGRNTAKESQNDIAVQDREASRSHAKISSWEHKYYIQDLNSSTGTRVNGQKLTPFEDLLLANGAEISIGPRVKFRFKIETPSSPEATLIDIDVQDELRTIDDDRTVW